MIKNHPIEPEELMAYLDGELSHERVLAAGAHLDHCAECQNLAAELSGVSQHLKTWQVENGSVNDSALQTELEAWSAKQIETPRVLPRWMGGQGKGRPLLARRLIPALLGLLLLVGAVVSVKFVGMNGNTAFYTAPEGTALPPTASDTSARLNSLQARAQDTDTYRNIAKPGTGKEAKDRDHLEQFGKLNRVLGAPSQTANGNSQEVPLPTGPMIIRTSGVTLVTKEFDQARTRIEETVRQHHGYVGDLNVTGAAGSGRTLQATLRIPANELDAALAEVKKLGRVEGESQNGQDVTSQYVDLQARLTNARNTEQRLTDLLRERTGKLSDVLAVETELARVRGEIEQMEAERKTMLNQVSFATLNATITEDYQAQLQVVPPSTSTRLVNAAVDGYHSMVDGLLGVTLFLLSAVPSLLLWTAILFFPARFAWKKLRSLTA